MAGISPSSADYKEAAKQCMDAAFDYQKKKTADLVKASLRIHTLSGDKKELAKALVRIQEEHKNLVMSELSIFNESQTVDGLTELAKTCEDLRSNAMR
jgi:hypothetical protein